jgi:hypothetical protein
MAAVPALAYSDFARALKGALRDFHRPDLLARRVADPMIEPRERGGGKPTMSAIATKMSARNRRKCP